MQGIFTLSWTLPRLLTPCCSSWMLWKAGTVLGSIASPASSHRGSPVMVRNGLGFCGHA